MNPLDHFETLYASNDDPWNVRDAWYEQRKRAMVLACLRKPHYRNVFEPGCGNGEMSLALALRADRVLACDGSPSAVAAALRRVPAAGAGSLLIEERRLPLDWPQNQQFDLIVMSEFAYYFGMPDIERMLALAHAGLAADGELVMCNNVHDFDDRVVTTAALHAAADALPGLVRTLSYRDADFLLEAWRPAAPGDAA
jgi:cyclopropane fatty-acyl-phospholipid synthase-like methyltransferase